MAVKKSTRKKAGKRKAGKKKPAPTVRNLINDAISNPEIRSALYKNPRAVAKRRNRESRPLPRRGVKDVDGRNRRRP